MKAGRRPRKQWSNSRKFMTEFFFLIIMALALSGKEYIDQVDYTKGNGLNNPEGNEFSMKPLWYRSEEDEKEMCDLDGSYARPEF